MANKLELTWYGKDEPISILLSNTFPFAFV